MACTPSLSFTRLLMYPVSQSPLCPFNKTSDPLGLISLADDACRCPEGIEGAFINKLLDTWTMTPETPPSKTNRKAAQGFIANDDDGDNGNGNSSWVVCEDPFSTEEKCSFIVKHFVGE